MRKLILLVLPLLAITACDSITHPQAMAPAAVLASASISDAAHDGMAGLYFLPPMVSNPDHGGSFDGHLSPAVEICATTACESLHASFSMTEGSGSEVVRMVAADEHYIVNWHAGSTGAEAGETYRVRVLVNGLVLGYADVTAVSTAREAVTVRSDGSIVLVATQTLPVKFRIETGVPGAVVVTPAEAMIDVGESQQFSAALYDLHGEPLVGPAVTWSSGDTDVATVDGDGLATGVAEGSASIAASAGPANGSAALTVTGATVVKSWHIMPGFESHVFALATYADDLIAGGVMGLARWEGEAWEPMVLVNDRVRALVVFEDDLIVGGEFTRPGTSTNRVARWDGTSWQPMDTGMNSAVRAFSVHEGDLIAGGSFTTASGQTANRVARWSGSGWQPIGTGMDAHVFTLAVYDGDLIAGGSFTTASGQTANRVARWDGTSWQPMGTGMAAGTVFALVVHDGNLIASGSFTSASGQSANRVARWDGTAWQPMDTGMNHIVYTLTVFEGDLIAGGSFTVASGQTARRTARWDGSAWQPMGNTMNQGEVHSFTTFGSDLIAGGRFSIQLEPGALFSWNILGRWGTP